MSDDDFPNDVRQFIERHIESIVQLETLLLLRQDRGRQWNADQIAKSLYISNEASAGLLNDLNSLGFIRSVSAEQPTFAYDVKDDQTDQLIGRLDEVYGERRVAVISLIYSKPTDKVQTFADAFRLRKEN